MVKSVALVAAAAAVVAACRTSDGSTPHDRTSPAGPADGTNVTPPSEAGTTLPDRPADAGSPPSPPTVISSESLDVAGEKRSFVLAVPTTYSPQKRYPLVLVLHGDGGDGTTMRAALPFDSISAEAAVVAYPSGTDGWNLYDPAATNEDLAFLVALVDTLKARFTVDPSRVFGMGFSSGAFMVNQVACRRPSLFRAVAPHSGGAPDEPRDPTATRWSNDYTRCANQTMGSGPAVLVIHGTADTVVSYGSGTYTAAYWAFINGCESTRSTNVPPPPCLLHDACPASRPVVLCAIPELGHALWSGAAQAAWHFFEGL
jgi:polyhydroxybutyrate depolymerase